MDTPLPVQINAYEPSGTSARADFDPIFVQAFKFVAEFHLFGFGKVQSRVAYFQIFLAGRDFDGAGFVELLSGEINLFDKDGRRRRIGLSGVYHYDAFDGGKP